MILGPVTHFEMVQVPWSQEAEEGLRDTFYGHGDMIKSGVESGKMILLKVFCHTPREVKTSWLVLERMPNMLFIWCYQGVGLVRLVDCLRQYAATEGFQQLSFFTHHQAALRGLRRFHPFALLTPVEGEAQYIIDTGAHSHVKQ